MAYAGHREARNRSATPPAPPPIRTVVTRVTRSGRQIQISPRERSPWSDPAVIAQRLQEATIPVNPYEGMNPSAFTGGVFGVRRSMPMMPAPQSFSGVAIIPPQYGLGDNGEDDYGQFSGISLKGITKAIKKVASPVQRAVTAVGHTVGTVVTSKIGQGVLGAGLALTGVGFPAAAAIFAGTKGVGSLIKPGGNIKHALTGAAQGAVEGVASVAAGQIVRKAVVPAVKAIGSKILGHGGPGGAAATGAQVLEQATGMGPTGPYVGVGGGGDAAAIADAQRQIAEATAAATAAQQEAARQAAEAAAAAAAASSTGNDQAAAALRAQIAELQKQQQAAADAVAAANAAQTSANGSTDTGQLQALIDAARKAQAAAQAAAAAPATSGATAAVQDAAQGAIDATGDAIAGAPQEASVLGGLTSNPLMLGAILVGAVVVFGRKKKGRRSRR